MLLTIPTGVNLSGVISVGTSLTAISVAAVSSQLVSIPNMLIVSSGIIWILAQ